MTRPLQTRLLALGAGVALWLGHAAVAAQGQVLEESEDGLDCVIEPHAIVKLGSVEEGTSFLNFRVTVSIRQPW